MKRTDIKKPWEFLLLTLLLRWEQKSPPDRQWGELDRKPTCNCQETRLGYVLQKIAVGQVNEVYSLLARYTRRRDGNSYIAKGASWMKTPIPLWEGWYVEGCQSLKQKFDILDNLTKLGFTPEFEACAKDFVAGRSVEDYLPCYEDLKVMFKNVPGVSFSV